MALILYVNAAPRVAVVVDVDVMIGVAFRVITRVILLVVEVLVAERMTLKVLATPVGVPEMEPVDGLMARPLGRTEVLKDVDELFVVI